MSDKFLSAPKHRAHVSSREVSPRTLRSRVAIEAPLTAVQSAELATWSEPASREIVLASAFVDARGDTLPSFEAVSDVARSRALGFQGWRCP